MIPNVARVLDAFMEPYTIKTVTKQTTDFVSSDVVVSRTINAVVQPAQKDKLNPDKIDWSLAYVTVHSKEPIANGDLIVYGGQDYKIIDNGDYQRFGYTEGLGEQTKRAAR